MLVAPRPLRGLLVVLLGSLALALAPVPVLGKADAGRAAEAEARLRRDVIFLASDSCEGRGPLTEGINRAADYIATEFKKAGLQPAGPGGSYFQPFTIPGAILDGPAQLALTGPLGQEIQLKQGAHFYPMGLGHAGKVEGPLVFVGYGITSPRAKYDDYQDVDVTDKVVIMLRDTPRSRDRGLAAELKQSAPFYRKLANAQKHGAAAVLFVNSADIARDGDDLLDFNYTALARLPAPAKVPAFHIRRSVLEDLLRGSGASEGLGAIEQAIDRDLRPHSIALTGWSVRLEVRMHQGRLPLKNVAGLLEGNGPLADETIVIGAHYDHLGYGEVNASLAGLRKRAIHHGADDNGSGTTALMELARRFAAQPSRQGRRLLFIAFSGEEMGLLGSKYYCEHPLLPLRDTAAMFNMDMVGRLRPDKDTGKDKLLSEGSGTARPFKDLLDRLARKYDFKMVNKPGGLGPSDHYSFCQKKVPVLFFWTDYHPDYHRPSDTANKINVPGMRKVVDVSAEVVTALATMERPEFIKVKEGPVVRPSLNMPRLGIRPAYGDESDGVLVDGVTEGLPADRAGIKEGDRVVEMAGKPVKNLSGYMQILSTQKKGNTVEVVVVRQGKRQTLSVKLE